jgi:TonB family protein
MQEPTRRRLVTGVLLSLAVHLTLVLLLSRASPPEHPARVESRETIRLKVLDRVEEAAREREAALARREREALRDAQIVEIPRPEREEIPDKARFLSQYDSKVEKEQRPRHRGRPSQQTAAPSPGPPRKAAERPAPPPAPEGLPDALGDTLAEGATEQAPDREGRGKVPRSGGQRGLKGGIKGLERMLVPGMAGAGRGTVQNARTLGGPFVSDDVFLGVEDEGDVPLVNSRSFKYWDFFRRVKDRVRDQWNPGGIYQARDPDGKVYGSKDRLTVLTVILEPGGGIARLEVAKESGLPFLDEEAMRAFREAGPFPNPPKGLVDESGRIRFNFGFLLEVGSARGRFFWQQP